MTGVAWMVVRVPVLIAALECRYSRRPCAGELEEGRRREREVLGENGVFPVVEIERADSRAAPLRLQRDLDHATRVVEQRDGTQPARLAQGLVFSQTPLRCRD